MTDSFCPWGVVGSTWSLHWQGWLWLTIRSMNVALSVVITLINSRYLLKWKHQSCLWFSDTNGTKPDCNGTAEAREWIKLSTVRIASAIIFWIYSHHLSGEKQQISQLHKLNKLLQHLLAVKSEWEKQSAEVHGLLYIFVQQEHLKQTIPLLDATQILVKSFTLPLGYIKYRMTPLRKGFKQQKQHTSKMMNKTSIAVGCVKVVSCKSCNTHII